MRAWLGQTLAFGVLGWTLSCSPPPSSPETKRVADGPRPNRESINASTLRALGEWEVQQAKREQGTWRAEFIARRYEEVMIALWDRLNQSEDRLGDLRDLPLGQIQLASLGEVRELDHGIQRAGLRPWEEPRDGGQWTAWVTQWIQAGWQIEYQECRQSGFDLTEPSRPRSTFDLVVHVKRSEPEQRGILRGRVEIQWQAGSESKPPEMDTVFFREGEWVTLSGPPFFNQVVSREMMPHSQTQFIDPVLVGDFDGNGRSDVLFSGCNVLYAGVEGGGMRSEPFVMGSKPVVYTSVYADLDGDGLQDYVWADRKGVLMLPGGSDRRTLRPLWKAPEMMPNPSALTAGDMDGDGDLDLWLMQYKMPYIEGQMPTPFYDANDGFPSFLLENDGRGNLSDVTQERGLAALRWRRSYSGSFVDLDRDGDLDLLNVSDFAGLDLYRNDGAGRFQLATSDWVDESLAFGMAHTFGDFDGNGSLDFLMIGMNSAVADRLEALSVWPEESPLDDRFRSRMAFGNRLYSRRGNRFELGPMGPSVARSGWSWGVGSLDFDNDGDLDLYIANGHKTRASAKDYDEQFWCHDIHVATSEANPMLDLHFRKVGTQLYGQGYSYGGHQRNAFFLNLDGKAYLEVAYLLGLADDGDGRNVLCEDIDQDGLVDILVTTSQIWPVGRQYFRLYQNLTARPGNWIGVRAPRTLESGSWLGAELWAWVGGRPMIRTITSGDGYRTQAAGALHFGVGDATAVERIEIRRPGRDPVVVTGIDLGRYHDLSPADRGRESQR